MQNSRWRTAQKISQKWCETVEVKILSSTEFQFVSDCIYTFSVAFQSLSRTVLARACKRQDETLASSIYRFYPDILKYR